MTGRDLPPLHWPTETPRHDRRTTAAQQVKRWGMRLLGFLTMAFIGVVVSSVVGHYDSITALLVLVGLPGAAVCTVLGLKALYQVPPDQRTRGRLRN